MRKPYTRLLTVALAVTALAGPGLALVVAQPSQQEGFEFKVPRQQAKEFIGYNRSVILTPRQERVMRAALFGMQASCCKEYSAYTCCCTCNLSKTVWGFSKHLIANEGYGAKEVRAAVKQWIHYINPEGFSGNACFSGRCNKPFKSDGCGGMKESNLIFPPA
ncbi:MAG: hypothetical protein ACE5HV_09965 [Acidobacteriota bacterium]